jgi:L-threonylcarbamoyladenylate synthase
MGALIGIDLDYAADLLEQGKLVAIPTETVYGLAANGLNTEAVSGIFAAKNRPTFDPLILHVGSVAQAKSLCIEWPEAAEKLATAFWPGPLTLVLPKANHIPDLVTADHPTVAVRMPNNAMSLALLQRLSFPLAAPSANPFGYVSPTNAQHVFDQLGERIDYILDGGPCAIGIESTIVSVDTHNRVTVLRLGGLDLEALSEAVGHSLEESLSMHSNPQAPGQLDQHYSPGCAMIPFTNFPSSASHEEKNLAIGFLWFSENDREQHAGPTMSIGAKNYVLTASGDDREAAMNLFGTLRQFDKDGCTHVYFTWAPKMGLGRAINDRLKRASAKSTPH